MYRHAALPFLFVTVAGCGSPPGDGGPPSGEVLAPEFAQPQALTQALEQFERDRQISRSEFDARYAVPFADGLDFDPLEAEHLDLIQASILGLDGAEQESLAGQGFAIASDPAAPTFAYAYQTIYALDLPVYITLDSLLDVMHVHYDDSLAALERAQLSPALEDLLERMREPLEAVQDPGAAELDADLYLSVAINLLSEQSTAPAFEANQAQVSELLGLAEAAEGSEAIELFGGERLMDFSQFLPRGHYAGEPLLERYFRAMMWLGRVDLRLIEPIDGQMVFQRRQFELMGLLDELLEPVRDLHARIDAAIETFVGEPDYMTPEGVTRLRDELGGGELRARADELGDDELARALQAGGHGLQRISSHVLQGEWKPGQTTPLPVSFALLGQRYVVDSEVFSNLVWDRLETKRMMPDPLDAAFAALGNDQAASLLADELDAFDYHGDLHAVRRAIEAQDDDFWQLNLYNRWLSALRALSPTLQPEGLPAPLDGEPWGRRLLLSQLGSWAQLRHDTILYAKQSYTAGAACEFPDAYVDPYPEAIDAIHDMLAALVETLEAWDMQGADHARASLPLLQRLSDIAAYERDGEPLRAEDLAWINEMIDASPGCGDPGFSGWYGRDMGASQSFDPTIADVHTQPTDEVGNPVGRVLHVGTGMVHYMVASLDTPQGARAFVAPVFGYRELVTEDYDRWDDERWSASLQAGDGGQSPSWAPVTAPLESTDVPALLYCGEFF